MCANSVLQLLCHMVAKWLQAVPGVHLHTTLTGERERDQVLEFSVKVPRLILIGLSWVVYSNVKQRLWVEYGMHQLAYLRSSALPLDKGIEWLSRNHIDFETEIGALWLKRPSRSTHSGRIADLSLLGKGGDIWD